jgi:hypothetical protein
LLSVEEKLLRFVQCLQGRFSCRAQTVGSCSSGRNTTGLICRQGAYQCRNSFQTAVQFIEYLAARNDLGAQFIKLKRFDEASNTSKVIENDPKNFNAKFNLGLVRVGGSTGPAQLNRR